MRSWVFCALAACSLAVIGCKSDIPVYPVKGKITFDGKPMKGGGGISFVPVGNQPGKTAGGEIKEDGTYELMTHKPGDGSMTGEFRVVISQVVEQEGERVADGEKPSKKKKGTALPEDDRIPLIYADAYKSPLTAKVEAKGNEIDFDLKRDAKGAMRGDALRGGLAERPGPRFTFRPN